MTLHVTPRAQEASRLPLRLSDLVRSVDREPRIPDLTLAERLGFAKPHNVRKLIARNRDELQLHGALVERPSSFLRHGENPEHPQVGGRIDQVSPRNRGGRPGTMWFLNEGQALVICALSRTPIAVKVRQDVIAVYMAHRRGEDWLPPSQRERKCLRDIIERGHVYPPREAFDLHGEREIQDTFYSSSTYIVAEADHLLIVPADAEMLDALAAFEADDVTETEDERDGDHGQLPDGSADSEPALGWNEHVGQLTLQATEDGDETATERHGAGFLRSGGDDSEDSHDAEHVNEDGGDINDEPHDEHDEGDREWSLGWPEQVSQLGLRAGQLDGDLECDAGDEPEVENEHGDIMGQG